MPNRFRFFSISFFYFAFNFLPSNTYYYFSSFFKSEFLHSHQLSLSPIPSFPASLSRPLARNAPLVLSPSPFPHKEIMYKPLLSHEDGQDGGYKRHPSVALEDTTEDEDELWSRSSIPECTCLVAPLLCDVLVFLRACFCVCVWAYIVYVCVCVSECGSFCSFVGMSVCVY